VRSLCCSLRCSVLLCCTSHVFKVLLQSLGGGRVTVKISTCVGELFAVQLCVLNFLTVFVATMQEAASVVKDKTKARCAS
jgi:hypothetical protein